MKGHTCTILVSVLFTFFCLRQLILLSAHLFYSMSGCVHESSSGFHCVLGTVLHGSKNNSADLVLSLPKKYCSALRVCSVRGTK
jgi:hypothetical protein